MPGTQPEAAGSLLVLVRGLRVGIWMELACAERDLGSSQTSAPRARSKRRGIAGPAQDNSSKRRSEAPSHPEELGGEESFVPSSHQVLSCSKTAFGNSIIHSFNQQAFTEFRLK